jgi:hypothetical protein
MAAALRRPTAARAAAIALVALAAVVVTVDRAATANVACESPAGFEPRGRASSADAAVLFRTEPPAITVGTLFTLEAIVCGGTPPPVLTRVDAQMPEHRHGMNYRPTLAAKSPGRYVAEGFLFHMPGRWQFVFDVEASGRRTRLTTDVNVE